VFRRRWRETAYSRCTSHPFSRVVMTFIEYYGIMAVLKVKYLHFLYCTDILLILSNSFFYD
ncbi:hypothetical protein, partial [Streptococcus pseudopneumoniae]|uniref:hypothetical protein n=1 Tax=Streptococcus pseudopneumoniae TaxID=257758 RepID=UPI001AAE58DB